MVAGLFGGLFVAAVALCGMQRGEIRYLRGQLELRQQHERRIERVAAGLSEIEVKHEPEDVPPPGIQTRLEEAIGAWSGGATQEQLWSDVRAYRQQKKSWQWIVNELESD